MSVFTKLSLVYVCLYAMHAFCCDVSEHVDCDLVVYAPTMSYFVCALNCLSQLKNMSRAHFRGFNTLLPNSNCRPIPNLKLQQYG